MMWITYAMMYYINLQEAVAHSGLKESKVRWLGDSDIIVTSGFNQVNLNKLC